MERLHTLSLQTPLLQTSGTKHLHLPRSSCHRGQECRGELTAPAAPPAQPEVTAKPHLAAVPVPFQALGFPQLWGHRGCCHARPCPAASLGCSRHSMRRVLQMDRTAVGSGKQLLPHTFQQGELSRDLLCSKGPGAAACPSTLQGPRRGCCLCSLRGHREV